MGIEKTIVSIGEALYDFYPDGSRHLGGAPLNVSIHATQLGNKGILITRIGQDKLGDQLLLELKERELLLDHIQTDPDFATGTVSVKFADDGEPTFDITPNVAWDYLQFDFDLVDVAQEADAICFNTTAQRVGQTRNTIYRFLTEARRAIKLYDVNLRPGDEDRQIISRSLELANALKANATELAVLQKMFVLGDDEQEAAIKLLKQFELQWFAVTHGSAGTTVYTTSDKHEGETVTVEQASAVGAGDSTIAALLHGATRQWEWSKTLKLSNALGAYVASQPQACPVLTDEIKKLTE